MNEIQLIEWKIVHSNKRFIYTWMNNNEQSSINDPVFRYVGFTIHFFFFIQFFSCSRSAFQNRLDWQIRNHLNEEVLSNNNTIFPIKNSILLMVRFLFFCVCFCFSTFWWQWCVLSTFTRANKKKSTHKLSSLWRILMLFKKPWLNTINNFSICMNRKLRFIYIVEIKRRTSAAHWWIFVCVCFQNCASVLRSNRTHSTNNFENFLFESKDCVCVHCAHRQIIHDHLYKEFGFFFSWTFCIFKNWTLVTLATDHNKTIPNHSSCMAQMYHSHRFIVFVCVFIIVLYLFAGVEKFFHRSFSHWLQFNGV